MNEELRDPVDGRSIEERLAELPGGLPVDAVALWYVVSAGQQGFKLTGNALTDFVRRGILALLREGAKPVVAAKDRIGWDVVDYGSTSDVIANAIVKEWLDSGGETHSDPRGLWFALPSQIHSPRFGQGPA